MKKLYVLLALGAFLMTGGLMSKLYVHPRLAVAPSDLDAEVLARNPPGRPATYFSIAKLREVTGELGNRSRAVVDAEATEQAREETGEDVMVVHMLGCTDPVEVDCTTDRTPLSGTISKVAIDRSSGRAVPWSGAYQETGGTRKKIDFQGLTIKYPFNTQKKSYGFWNGDFKEPRPSRFVRETTLHGLKVYEFKSEVKPTDIGTIDVPGALVGQKEPTVTVHRMISSRTTSLVEPETGVIMSATSTQDSYAALDGKRVFSITKGTFTTPEDVAADSVKEYQGLSKALFAMRVVVPVAGIGAGGLVTIGAFTLIMLKRRRTPTDLASTPLRRNDRDGGSEPVGTVGT